MLSDQNEAPGGESDLEPLAGKAEEKKPKFIEHREPTKSKGVLKKHIFKKKKKKVDPDEELKNIATTLGQITSEKPDEESEEWKAFQEMQNRISGSVQLAKEKVEVLKSTESEIKEAVEKTQDYVVPSWEDFDREKRENKGEVEDIKIPELPPIAPLPMIKTIPEQPRGQQMKVEPTKKMPPKKPDPPKAMPPKKPAPPKVIPKVVPADIQGDEELNLELRIVESGDEEEKVKEEDPFDDEFLNLSQRSVPDEGNKDAFSLSGSGGGTDLPGVHAPVKTMTSLEKELLGLSVEEPVADNSGTAKSTVDSIVDDFLGISSTTQPLQPSKPIIGDDLFGLSHKEKVEADLQETALTPALLPQPAVINPILASPIHVADPGDIFSSASDATQKAAEPGDLFGEPLEPTKVESTVDPFTVNLDKIQKEQEQKVEDDFDPRALDDDDELDFDPRSEKDLPKDLAVSTKPTEAVWGDSASEEPGEFKAHLLESEKAMEQAQQAAEEAGALLEQPKRNPFLSEDSGFSSSNPFSANTDMESMFPDSGFNASVSKAKEPTTGEVDPFLCLMGNNDTSKPAADFETIAEGDDAFDPFQTITDDGEPHMPGFSSFNADSFDLGMNDTSKDTDKNKSDNVTAPVSDNVAPVDNLIDIPGLAPVVKDTPKSAEPSPTTIPKVDNKPHSKKEEAKQEEPKKEVQSVEKQDNKYEVKKEHIIPRRRTVAPPSPKIIKPEIIPVPRKRAKDIDITAPKEVTIKPLDTTTAEALPIAPALPPPPTPIIEEYSTSDDSSPEKSPKKSCSFDGTPNLEYEAIAKEIEEIDKAKPVKERRNSETYEDDYDELEKLEPLPPYHPKFEGEGWSLLMRIGKKKMTKERAWRPCFVRLIENQGRFTLRVFNTEEEKHPLHEVQLAPNFNMSDVKLQYYDDYGKIHIFKLYSVTYKERVGFKAERLAPSQIKANFQTFKKAVMRHPKTTDLIDHSKVKTELFKFGCKDRPMICSLVQEIEDALMKVVATRGSPQTYIKDECNAEIWDEYEGTVDKSGHIENQKGRVRIFYKAFINDHPKVELGINDKRRRGKEVVRRKDIVPVKTDEWIRIETPEFHNCVDMKEWNENQMIIFTPLDAIESELMRFRVRPKQNFQLPLQVRVQMVVKERHVEIRSDVIVPGYFNMKRKHSQVPCEDIMIRFPLPEAWIYLFRTEKHFRYGTVKSIRKKPGKIKGLDRLAQMAQGLFNYGSIMEVSTGQAKYEHIYRSIVWRISRLPELNQGAYKEHIFILRLDLGPHDIMPETYEQYAEVEFTMPNTTVSKCAVRSIAVEGPDDPPEKWVNYLSKYEYKVEIEFKTGDTPEDVPAYAITPTSPTEKKEVPEYPEYNPDEPDDSSSSDED
ncbi:unnamed protein product [Owenia fusiformis]|uniref:Uncharacterized protein n=1 Tax=Owenia fusiformis TaxID=6347 RepID=A0A8J1U5T2_OWEFU|nr:unnamed protein product [Owenia fusiformis]